jgi:D-alanine-D-alanine ligase-like ATP-grasp enzyme
MKIVVLAGGLSPERDVSLSSGSLIANALIDNGHDVLLVDLYLGIESDVNQSLFLNKQSQKRYHYQVPPTEPNLEKLMKESGNGENLIGKNVIEICKSVDIVFISLHGSIGENGQLQANLKKEAVHWRHFKTREEARQAIFAYIEGFYNTRRIQKRLDYLSPIQWLRRWENGHLSEVA